MCWWVTTMSPRSASACPRSRRACSSRSSASPEFGPVSTSVRGSSSMSQQLTRPTMKGVGMASPWIPSGTDEIEHLVPPPLHVLLRDDGLEVQPQERLGVGGPDVEVPVLVVDGDPVEAVEFAVRGPIGDLGHLRVLVGDLRVDLAGDEVLPAQRLDELEHRLALHRQKLEDEERRERPRVGVVEVAEVVVAGDLAAEGGALLTHAGLEERVP